MPPWNQMTPQQQQMLLQMLMQRGAGMQQPAQLGINPMGQQLANPLANQQAQQSILQNPQMLQYLMAMRGAQPPTMAQFMGGQQPVPAYTQYPGF